MKLCKDIKTSKTTSNLNKQPKPCFQKQKIKVKGNLESVNQQNTIAKGTTLTGDIINDGDFRIEGTVQGNIKTPGKVVLGKTGIINGILHGANADIEGKFSGKLILTDTLTLKATAYVEGEVGNLP